MTYSPPRRLTAIVGSPNYDRKACDMIDQVMVDGVVVPQCVAYDMDKGWAFGKDEDGIWTPRVHGTVTVTVKKGAHY